jgi:hypothetical protein
MRHCFASPDNNTSQATDQTVLFIWVYNAHTNLLLDFFLQALIMKNFIFILLPTILMISMQLHCRARSSNSASNVQNQRASADSAVPSDSIITSTSITIVNIPDDTTVSFRLASTMPPVIMHFAVSRDTAKSEPVLLYQIDLRLAADSRLIQSIRDTSYMSQALYVSLDIDDVNFDGYTDFFFSVEYDAMNNRSYHFWTYDTTLHRYLLNYEFSNELNGELDVDASNKQISTAGAAGSRRYSETYKVVNSHLELVRESSDK